KNGENGGDGTALPVTPPSVLTFNGKGGFGAADPAGGCTAGAIGAYGEPRAAGVSAAAAGAIDETGWLRGDGKDGEAGNAGQGGGGGGGDNFSAGLGGGGGGGCGGCGGAGGKGGLAG